MHNQLTKKDIEDMEAEIEHRKAVVRKELLEDVKEARAQGDLSENFEYYAAKKAKNQKLSQKRQSQRYKPKIPRPKKLRNSSLSLDTKRLSLKMMKITMMMKSKSSA